MVLKHAQQTQTGLSRFCYMLDGAEQSYFIFLFLFAEIQSFLEFTAIKHTKVSSSCYTEV